jgi:RsiW-degrading membrane proteinase PrsW (M82 family)
MVLNIISSANLGDWITSEVWWTVAIIIGVIGLCVIGYFYKPKEDGPMVVIEAMMLGLCAAFWPIVLIAVVVIGAIALPVLLGMCVKRLKSAYEKEKKERLKMMSDAEKIMRK